MVGIDEEDGLKIDSVRVMQNDQPQSQNISDNPHRWLKAYIHAWKKLF